MLCIGLAESGVDVYANVGAIGDVGEGDPEDDDELESDGVLPADQASDPVDSAGGDCGLDFLRRTELRKKSSSQFSSMV